jgi:hypothetical protein
MRWPSNPSPYPLPLMRQRGKRGGGDGQFPKMALYPKGGLGYTGETDGARTTGLGWGRGPGERGLSVGVAGRNLPGQTCNHMLELHSSPYQRLMIAEMNTACVPAVALMDGFEAVVEGGPEAGKRVEPGVILAGKDRVAIDALGVDSPEKIGMATTDKKSRDFVGTIGGVLRQGWGDSFASC